MKWRNEIYIDAEDFYWQISEDELYDPTQEPRVEELGQLSDDWSELLRLKREEEIPISYDLNRLATILKIIKKKRVGILWIFLAKESGDTFSHSHAPAWECVSDTPWCINFQ